MAKGRKYDTEVENRPLLNGWKVVISLSMERKKNKDIKASKPVEIDGITALQWAREISKLPDGNFIVCFFPYSRSRGLAGEELVVKKKCKYRTQLPEEAFDVDGENYFLFEDERGEAKMCYRILIRYMGFPNDGYKLHKIKWL